MAQRTDPVLPLEFSLGMDHGRERRGTPQHERAIISLYL